MSHKAFIIAAASSGSGKTTLTLGLLAALKKHGKSVQAFKCGPDFIDPTLHQLITGRPSRNLDLWMCGEAFVKECFERHSRGSNIDVSVVEGVMGLFDGGASSTASLAKALKKLPVLLVLDAGGMAESAAAVVKGFETLDPDLNIMGVIFNNIGSQRHYKMITESVSKHCKTKSLGYLPKNAGFEIPHRHLGLRMGVENPIDAEALERLADTVKEHIDLEAILVKAEVSSPVTNSSLHGSKSSTLSYYNKVSLAVAMDRAFCFYYEDNLEMLRRAGAELLPFSPLSDKHLPTGIDGLYLGGGYPEMHAAELSANTSMLASVKKWTDGGGVTYAECGGFMYLTEGITDFKGRFHSMAGLFPTRSVMNKKRVRLGYREVELKKSSCFGKSGTLLRGHEFHYSDINEMPQKIERVFKLSSGKHEGYRIKNTLGGYIHIHFGFSPEAAESFVKFCKKTDVTT